MLSPSPSSFVLDAGSQGILLTTYTTFSGA